MYCLSRATFHVFEKVQKVQSDLTSIEFLPYVQICITRRLGFDLSKITEKKYVAKQSVHGLLTV